MSIYLNMRGVTDGRQVIRGVKFLPTKIFNKILNIGCMEFNTPYIITNDNIQEIIEYYENILSTTPRTEMNSYILDSIAHQVIPSLEQELPRNDAIRNEWYTIILE